MCHNAARLRSEEEIHVCMSRAARTLECMGCGNRIAPIEWLRNDNTPIGESVGMSQSAVTSPIATWPKHVIRFQIQPNIGVVAEIEL